MRVIQQQKTDKIGPIKMAALKRYGRGLSRPECVLATRAGVIYVSDSRGGIMEIAPDGAQHLLQGGSIIPNGIALMRDGSLLIANIEGAGGIWRLFRDGSTQVCVPLLTEVEGEFLDSVNFVAVDAHDRIWFSVSSQGASAGCYDRHTRTGFIGLLDRSGARIVADALCWTNEFKFNATGTILYVNETFARCTTIFDVAEDGSLRNRRLLTTYGAGDFPDGLALDAAGSVWVTSVISNRLIRVALDGSHELLLEDPDSDLGRFEQEYSDNTLTRASLGTARGQHLGNISSIAFAGPDLRTVLLGSLNGRSLHKFRSPVAGLPPVHWQW